MRPKGSAMKLPPQKSIPEVQAGPEPDAGVWSPGPWSSTVAGLPSAAGTLNLTAPCSWPTRLAAQAETPVAMAGGGWGVSPGADWAMPNSSFFDGGQPLAGLESEHFPP